MKKIVCIKGPTASGKTALAVEIARRLNGEIVGADSMQIYKYMNIGTAKPMSDELCEIKHHMIDFVDPAEDYSAARYVEDAAQAVETVFQSGKLPILCGGTGLYIDSLLSGRDFAARPGNEELRRALNEKWDADGGTELYRELQSLDPDAANRVHPNDKKRVVRALEVVKVTGGTISKHNEKTQSNPARYDAVSIFLCFADREKLYARIDRRVDEMMALGLMDEVRSLLDMGISQNSTAMQSIGYKELVGALNGDGTVEEAVEKIKQSTRHYAKRQISWFKRDTNALHLEVDGGFDETVYSAMNFLKQNGIF